ncbi:hypothetical protein HETIRDRAFT_418187 [Heterobasidion irregulare TC 32-1]|uniref:Uncharacterized protein n=1 Tax=Heterobasidion irregulare (strain TC 32-1) TaxID=747525 RepID=W4K8Y8_HETIT|nr:uncharacterized protein HETIRDRAFT_418187 [Heterobasidion irregulare TC 32-1]ETW82258.1 hypothetical protein HETIRDRAFT_418187 [Heterobasidion irregulare TC 32-1]
MFTITTLPQCVSFPRVEARGQRRRLRHIPNCDDEDTEGLFHRCGRACETTEGQLCYGVLVKAASCVDAQDKLHRWLNVQQALAIGESLTFSSTSLDIVSMPQVGSVFQ